MVICGFMNSPSLARTPLFERLVHAGGRMVDFHGWEMPVQFGGILSEHRAVRTAWPSEKPLFLRVSAEDYAEGGMTPSQMARIIDRVIQDIDVVHVSSGGVTPVPPPVFPGYQIPFAEMIKTACDVPTIAVGLITTLEMAEETICNNRADLVALGRELLRNPFFPLIEARKRGIELPWPEQYKRAFS